MFFVYAGLMALDTGLFAIFAMRYKYVKKEQDFESEQDVIIDNKDEIHDNKGFDKDEKY